MKQSSIEWLIEELNKSTSLTSFVPECSDDYKKEILGIIDQAKQLHKQEILNSFMAGAEIGEMHNNENRKFYIDGKQFYKNTYEKEN